MLPIAPLMIEHREIERLIALMKKEGDRSKEDKLTDIDFISILTLLKSGIPFPIPVFLIPQASPEYFAL